MKIEKKQTKEIDIYECFFYRQQKIEICKYYPKGCKNCGELVKIGVEKIERKTT